MSESKFDAGYGNRKFSSRFDEFGNPVKLGYKGNKLSFLYSKLMPRKKRDLKNYCSTGAKELGPTAPNPFDREDLIDFEHKPHAWYRRPIWAGVVTLASIIMDGVLYYMMFDELFGENLVLAIIAVIAAAAVTDFPPVIIGHSLRLRGCNERKVLKWIVVIITSFVVFFVSIVFGVRLGFIVSSNNYRWDYAAIQALIPIGTSLISLAINYMSFDPINEDVIRLKKKRLNLSDKVSQLKAVIAEINAQPQYVEDLSKLDDESYQTVLGKIEALGGYYRSIVRGKIAEACQSPADTTDLSVLHL